MTATDELRRLQREGDGTSWEQRSRDFSTAQVDAQVAYIEAEREAQQLQAENAKLRELAQAAWKCAHSGLSCSDCRTIAGGCTLKTAMRELGVDA